jgi:uncharacterized protein YjbI with pentapeptide repeats
MDLAETLTVYKSHCNFNYAYLLSVEFERSRFHQTHFENCDFSSTRLRAVEAYLKSCSILDKRSQAGV